MTILQTFRVQSNPRPTYGRPQYQIKANTPPSPNPLNQFKPQPHRLIPFSSPGSLNQPALKFEGRRHKYGHRKKLGRPNIR